MRTLIAAALVLLLSALTVRADTLAALRQSGVLRWGGDETGGAPYIYEQDGVRVGFEVELAEYLAAELGLKARFVQGQWDKLPSMLSRGDLDVVLNGYEWSAEREQEWASTIPYYVYKLQLIARKDDEAIKSWDDLRPSNGGARKRVGVLASSAAHQYLEKHWSDTVDIEAYSEGVTSAMQNVLSGQLRATLQDVPAAGFYLRREFPGLRPVGEPVAPGFYVMFCRRSDPELVAALNAAIRKAIADGTLHRIYQKYHVWTADQETLMAAGEPWPPEAAVPAVSLENLESYSALLSMAAGLTVVLSGLAMPLAMFLGMLVAIGRLFGAPWLARVLGAYVEIVRGTPLMLQLLFIYFILPEVGIRLLPFTAAVIGLAINYSSYESENYRAGILAVPAGQMEAALALGMSTWTALRRVILPQAVRIVVPLEINNFIALFKDTSICSVIAVIELTARFSQLLNNHPSVKIQLGLMTAALYLMMSYPLTILSKRLERRR